MAMSIMVSGLCLCTPAMFCAKRPCGAGAFADYFNLSRTSPHINYVGVGARTGFNVNPDVQIEAEMGYDFDRKLHE
jgi:hypothetical protein